MGFRFERHKIMGKYTVFIKCDATFFYINIIITLKLRYEMSV